MPCRRIGLVVHQGRPSAVEAARRVSEWATERSIPVAALDVWGPDAQRRSAAAEAAAAGHPDLVVTVGGDGTFLRGVRIAVQQDAPVLGVNVGRVGFLTEIAASEVCTALDAYAAGQTTVETRLMMGMRASRPLSIPPDLEVMLGFGRGALLPPPACQPDDTDSEGYGVTVTALNDVVFEKLARDRQAILGVYVDGRLFESYSADAVIISSPTGSTAYSFAAGGPILSPRLNGLVFTPVAPHMVFDRSLVVSAPERVGVRVLEGSGSLVVSVDGQLRGVLEVGDWIDVHATTMPARLVRLRPSQFYDRLRDRFSLAPAPAAAAGRAPLTIIAPTAAAAPPAVRPAAAAPPAASSSPPVGADQPVLRGGRIVLRPWAAEDADAVYEACQDPEIQRWTTVPSPYRHDDAVSYVTELAPAAWRDGAAVFAVLAADTGNLVGSIGAHSLRDGVAHIGYWTVATERRQGLTTEALRLVTDWFVGERDAARVELVTEPDNVASRRVAESAGFVSEGILRSRLVLRGRRVDVVMYSILAGEPVASGP